jgi:hypothetical protein
VMEIAHIVNPVAVKPTSHLAIVQPITFETMRIARALAADRIAVRLFSAQYPEDHSIVPSDFQRTPDLEKSVLDYGSFRKERKLPLIKHILDRLYDSTDAEYLAYTNVDIGLLPYFYLAVGHFIDAGYDAFVINRRTISDRFRDLKEVPLMYAEIGAAHRGWDCFVFPRDAYPDYELGSVCVGAPRVGLALIANLVAHARSFREFKDEHLTFHLGNDRPWGRSPYSDYADHNARESLRVLTTLEGRLGPFEPGTPPAIFLGRYRRFGKLYEWLVRHVHVPLAPPRVLGVFAQHLKRQG